MAQPPASEDPGPGSDPIGRFEDSMKELEGIVAAMEKGDLRLEESLRLFERGMVLSRECRLSLDSAELKVRDLLSTEGSPL